MGWHVPRGSAEPSSRASRLSSTKSQAEGLVGLYAALQRGEQAVPRGATLALGCCARRKAAERVRGRNGEGGSSVYHLATKSTSGHWQPLDDGAQGSESV